MKENLTEVGQRMAAACGRAGRRPDEVELVAVTKTVGPEEIAILHQLGVRKMGENRLQEATAKIPQAPPGIEWHMIGHLQRNKARQAVKVFDLIDSVDSARLAAEVSRHAARAGRTVPILLEANTSGEETKYGVPPAGLRALAEEVRALPGLCVEGLMTMAPFTDDMDVCRRCFASLRAAAERLADMEDERITMRRLSMGMTQDFEVAIEEGATEIRVGSALFAGLDE